MDLRVARGKETRAQILEAAASLLADEGYAGATMRGVAQRAEVQLSLVHYHFGNKKGLLVAVLEREHARVLEREAVLYKGPESIAEKWRKIVAHLRDDLESGYVRVLWELWSAGLDDPDLREQWRAAVASWRDLLEHLVEEWAAETEIDMPMSPRALATLVANAFHGAEVEMLAGVTEDEAPHLIAFQAVGELLDRTEPVKPNETLGSRI